MYGQDAAFVARTLGLARSDAVAVEAHPGLVERSPFGAQVHLVWAAVTTFDSENLRLHAVELDAENLGVSSLKDRADSEGMQTLTVPSVRAETLVNNLEFSHVDLVKIDVEGHAFEVLESFGKRLSDVRAIHVECETEEVWIGQRLEPEVHEFLKASGFVCASYRLLPGAQQSDSVWINRTHLT